MRLPEMILRRFIHRISHSLRLEKTDRYTLGPKKNHAKSLGKHLSEKDLRRFIQPCLASVLYRRMEQLLHGVTGAMDGPMKVFHLKM